TPPSPVQPGAWADLSAGCTGGPSLIQWSSSLASCSPLIGPNTVCNFPTEGTAIVSVSASYGRSFGGCFAFGTYPMAVSTVAASYGGSFGGSFGAFDSYPIAVTNAAAPSCYIKATPPGPVQPGAWADVSAGCSDSPTLIQWSSSLASCSPLIGPNTVCNFPT